MVMINQEVFLHWFSVRLSSTIQLPYEVEPIVGNAAESALSLETFNLLLHVFWHKIQYGLVIRDLDNILIFITTIRFIALVIRYNVYSSFLITLTSTIAAYIWYRHFLQTLFGYTRFIDYSIVSFRTILSDINRVRMEAGAYQGFTDLSSPLKILKYTWQVSFTSGEYGEYLIDPISMLIAKGRQFRYFPTKYTEFIYYTCVRYIIPKALLLVTALYREIGSFAAYTTLTRMGKRYCPYLIRWHWTMLIMGTLFENYSYRFLFRLWYLKDAVLMEQHYDFMEILQRTNVNEYYRRLGVISDGHFYLVDPMFRDAYLANAFMHGIMFTHLACIFYVLLHAVSGQYFYLPGFTDNVELSIGRRDKNSIYSGGYTSWQDPQERAADLTRIFPKVWYGWLGKGTKTQKNYFVLFYILITVILRFIIKLLRLDGPLKKLQKKLKKILKKWFGKPKKKKRKPKKKK